MTPRYRHHFTILSVLFVALAIPLAIRPLDRMDWLLENVLVLVAAIVFWVIRDRFVFSRLSYTLIFVFLCLHEIGSHYTYAKVPYDEWFRALTGRTFNELVGWERNNYDRVIHFLYGFLFAYPIREIFLRVANVRGFWGYFLPLDLTMSSSMLYELIEWMAVGVFGGELGMAYLGTQGDVWDAHKDMALASLGALLAMSLTAAVNVRWQRDFSREWIDSLRVKGTTPLGEEALAKMQCAKRTASSRKPRK
jgi:putative membrane protein